MSKKYFLQIYSILNLANFRPMHILNYGKQCLLLEINSYSFQCILLMHGRCVYIENVHEEV